MSSPIDIFLIVGQSNAAGYVSNLQTWSHATQVAWMFGKDYIFRELADPISTNSEFVDVAMEDLSGCAAKGSIWPLVATGLMATTGRPVCFAPCAIGGEELSGFWMPGADHRDPATNYGSLILRYDEAAKYGRVRAVLLWCGEGEVNTEMSEANFNISLDTFCNSVMADIGVPVMVAKLHDCAGAGGGNDETNVNNAIATAWADNPNCLQGPDLHGIASDDAWHIKGDAKAQSVADLWAAAIAARFPSPAGWSAASQTLTLVAGLANGEDAALVSGASATKNFGAHIRVVGGNVGGLTLRNLIKFDLRMIPADATITSATLRLYNTDDAATTASGVLQAHRILMGNAGWIDGVGTGDNALAGEPCWNAKVADGAGGVTTAWAGSAGLGASGTDYAATQMGAANWTDGSAEWLELALNLTEFGLMWSDNDGMRISATDEATAGKAIWCSSAENTTPANHPQLVVDYTLPSSGGGMLLLGVG